MCWKLYGKRKPLVRSKNIWTPHKIQRGVFFAVLSHAGERQVDDERLSEPQGEWNNTQTQKQNVFNRLNTYFSVENKQKPCQKENNSSFATYSKPTVLEGMFKLKIRFARTMYVGVKFVFTVQPERFTSG